ncbi:glycosyltransferase [Chryseobacterium formosus]|uniref:Glycosyltransferase n=1 Tax=Chryseobacterium formosus TaxID=1537363 RepID=A0ABT3XPU4_9FLAO|nr:glycosyltransferase family A protein [Chryseobacterium formosus]MCX8523532.1 glycosyltransferase [Chryseobacterium formosus]
MTPLLSIIVPTKNRYYYLGFLVDYFNKIDYHGIELIIHDNSNDFTDKTDFLSKLTDYNDSRIKYIFIENELSVIENSDRALLEASGEYICFIGDDDIFSKHLINYVIECKLKGIDAILPTKPSYSWPDIRSRFYGNKLSGKFSTKEFFGVEKAVDAKQILATLLKIGGCDILNLPRVYHGIVKHDLLKEIYVKTGSYFPGPSPDMANATALAILVKKMVEIDIPFVISGHSVKSTGGQGAAGKHFGEIKDIKHLPSNTASLWTKDIPFYWSGYTIYAESVIQALKRLNRFDLLEKFNFNYLYACCLVFDSSYKERINKTIKIAKFNKINVSKAKIFFYYIQIWKNRLIHHFKNTIRVAISLKNSKKVFEFENIVQVAEKNDEMIFNKNFQILKKNN